MINHKIYSSSKDLPNRWSVLSKNNILLQQHYFEALESSLPNNIKLYYLGIFKEEKLVGIALVQCVNFYLEDTIRRKTKSVVRARIKSFLSKFIKGTILVIGNLTHTGQHSVFYIENELTKQDFLEAIYKAVKDLKNQIENQVNKNIRLIMMKDYFLDEPFFNNNAKITDLNLRKTIVQPNMIMHVRSNWKSPDDYLLDMKTKYRTRYKRARKKLSNLKKHELTLDEIYTHKETMYKLYRNVSDKAPFNTFILPKNHFYELKEKLKNTFKVYGYFNENKMVGFYTLIENRNVLETYFLGYNPDFQQKNQLYLNMIYDMAFYGIENRFKSIVYARTAMEIKSSIGAKPYDMNLYMKHTNLLGNIILKWVFNFMKPKRDWEERHPFKF